MKRLFALFCLILILVITDACTPRIHPAGKKVQTPELGENVYHTADGMNLRVYRWNFDDTPRAILIGVHGFNDFGGFLGDGLIHHLKQNKIAVITYNQRGFGDNPERGIWAGSDTYVNDLAQFIHLVHSRNEGTPLYIIGESMGGAVVSTTLATVKPLPIKGAILSAPAVWGTQMWPWYQYLALYVSAHTLPAVTLRGSGIVQPTDNIEIWKSWSRRDEIIINTRTDALWGVSNLMDDAIDSAPKLQTPTLLLYGAKDEVIPAKSIDMFLKRLHQDHQFAFYPHGWHWLSRDLNGPTVWNDIVHWIDTPHTPLPSQADINARLRLEEQIK